MFVVGQLLPQLAELRHQPVFLDRILDCDIQRDLPEPFGIVRLHHVIGRAKPHRFDDRRHLGPARQHDDLSLGAGGLESPKCGETIEPRHHHVEEHHIRGLSLLDRCEDFVTSCIATRFVSAKREKGSQVGRKGRVIVNDRYVRFLQCFS
jgi:hypothetical protein